MLSHGARAVELYLKYKVKGSVERIFSALLALRMVL